MCQAQATQVADVADVQKLFRQTGGAGQGTLAMLHKHMDAHSQIAPETIRAAFKTHETQTIIARARQISKSFRGVAPLDKHTYTFLEKLCCDTAHESNTPSRDDHAYWEVMKDYQSVYVWTIPLHSISELSSQLPDFLIKLQNSTGHSIQILKTDNHPTYLSNDFQSALAKLGITHQTNRANPNNMSPYEMATGTKPHKSQLVVFGSITWVLNRPTEQTGKLHEISTPYIYVGQDPWGYRLWDPRDLGHVNIIHAVHCHFDESCSWTEEYHNEIANEREIARTTIVTMNMAPSQPHYFSPDLSDDENETATYIYTGNGY
jgi:hypothetical protein